VFFLLVWVSCFNAVAQNLKSPPGIFQIKLDHYQPNKKEQVHTTLAKQLALYVAMYSPLQMAADLPENYERFLDAFQFIKDVAVDWDDTRILESEPGDDLTIARKAKNRDEWYVGAITDEMARTLKISLSYLTPKRWYVATIYADAADAHWTRNPMKYQIRSYLVNDQTTLAINLASGGGAAISLKPASAEEMKKWKPYAGSRSSMTAFRRKLGESLNIECWDLATRKARAILKPSSCGEDVDRPEHSRPASVAEKLWLHRDSRATYRRPPHSE
jgi:hypothetical protein